MLRSASRAVGSRTSTIEEPPESARERRFRRLRLTLHPGNDDGSSDRKPAGNAEVEKDVGETWKKKNGLIHRERPAGRESPQQHPGEAANGAPAAPLQHHGPRGFGVARRTGSDREGSIGDLQDEMRYIREVRDSLEKVRERMYGQFGGMQQSMEKLSREIREANSHRKHLESEVKVRTTAMDSMDKMNSSLISANLSLQKSILENCQRRVDRRDEAKSLRSPWEKTQEELRAKERELAAAQAENQTLRLQVESSREAGSRAVQELAERIQREYEEKLRQEQSKHREEVEHLQAQLDAYIRRLEEAERNLKAAEAQIAERDQRITEVERLLSCMGKEKTHLQSRLQETEERLRLSTDTTDGAASKRSKELQDEAADLRDRIKHLNDMVFCQQRKVKAMIEEVESLRAQVAKKDMFISELLDRIAIVECENNELEDKLKYFMSTQNRQGDNLETRDIGVGCDLLPRQEAEIHEAPPAHPPSIPPPSAAHPSPSPTQCSSASPAPPPPHSSPRQNPYHTLNLNLQQRTYKPSSPPASRMDSSLLKFSPGQYSRYLESHCAPPPELQPQTAQSARDEVDTKNDTRPDHQQPSPPPPSYSSSSRPRSRAQGVSSPFLKLMELTSRINVE